MSEFDCQIGILYVSIHITNATSLKDRRIVLNSIKEKIRAKFNVSVADVGGQDKWQTATLAFCAVSNDGRFLENVLQEVLKLLDSFHRIEVCKHETEFL